MDNDYSLTALLKRLEIWGEKGLINKSTAKTIRLTVDRVLGNLDEEDKQDVRRIDPGEVIHRFSNLHPEVSPASLRSYKSRLEKSIQMFSDYHADKLNWKPDIGQRKTKKSNPRRNSPNSEQTSKQKESSQDRLHRENPHEETLNMPFPLRKDITIKISGIPRDLTTAECERLSAFFKALAVDFGTSS